MNRALLALAGLLAAGCTTSPTDARIGVSAPPFDSFPPVGDLLDLRCGSLDCHGSGQRNLVVWGCEGLRLDPKMSPTCGRGSATTSDEYAATYDSLVGLEPAVMSEVVQGKGANPELLTFVRKARGEEAHKGGAPIHAGDVSNECITRWLAGASADDANYQATCTAALQAP